MIMKSLRTLSQSPSLGSEEPWVETPFQKACIAFAEAFAGFELSSNNYTFNSENYISIPLLSAERSQFPACEIPAK